jgi:copper homeostasis protein
MIRPRTGDFLYSEDEIEVMREDIRVFKQHKVSGVVLGALKPDGRIDVEVTKRYVRRCNVWFWFRPSTKSR